MGWWFRRGPTKDGRLILLIISLLARLRRGWTTSASAVRVVSETEGPFMCGLSGGE